MFPPTLLIALWATATAEVDIRFGGTLGLTGKYAVTSKHAQRGIILVQETINSNPELYTRKNGDRYRVSFDIVDDQSRQERVRAEYARLATDERYLAVIGPYSSELSMVAAEAVNATGTGSVMMFHAGSNPSIYQRKFPNLFSTNILASDYFAGALRLLYQRGARTLSLAQGSQDFHGALCQGAWDHARDLGYEVKSWVSISGSDISEGIRVSSQFSPDVFVVCGHLHNAVQVTVTSRALTFNPKALVVAQATGDDFVNKVLARNALYLYGPLLWHPSIQQRCDVFGSAEEFDSQYSKRFGEAPTYHAALAAAAAIALFRAMEWADINLNSFGTEGLAEALSSNLVLETLAGSLNFSATTGLRIGGKGLAQQFMPLVGENKSRMDGYTSLAEVLLETPAQVVYPSPSWEMKELEIYPCPLGHVLTVDENECVPCPIGTYRSDDSVTCRTCPGGTYGLSPGLSECKSCSRGMDCQGVHNTGIMLAIEGWYYAEQSATFVPCQPSWVCLGGNRCSSTQRGSFCAKCRQGYTQSGPWSTGTAACSECPGWAWNALGLLGLVIWAKLMFRLLLYSHKVSIGSVTALHSIILRIVFNYFALLTSFTEAARGLQRHIGYRVLMALFLDPLRYFFSLDCMTGGQTDGSRPFLGIVVLGLFLLPCILMMSFAGILGTELLHMVITKEALPTTPPPVSFGADDTATKRDSGDSFDKMECSASLDPKAYRQACRSRTFTTPHFDISREEVERIVSDVKRRFVNKAAIWAFLVYPIVIHMLLEGAICVKKDVLRLDVDVDLVCQSPEHIQWFRLSVFGLMMYGVGIPCFVFFHLYRIRDRLMHLAVRRHFGFFYNGFEPNFYYFEAVYMLRKLLVLLALAIPTKTLRFLVMVALGLAFLGLHIRCEPFDDRDFFVLDRLELLSLTSFLFSCLAGLWFSYLEALPETMPGFTEFTRSEGFTAAIAALVASCHAAFILLAVWGLVRNIIVRHFRFLEECFPEHLSPFQKCILRCLDGRFHHVKLNPDTRELDTSQLSSDERRFLHSALSDTMAAYITAAVRPDPKVEKKKRSRFRRTRQPPDDDTVDYHRFYTGHMVAALRLAMKHVEYSRFRRALEYEEALAREGVEQHVTWFGKSFKRFKALLSASYAAARNEIKQHVRSSVRNTLRESIAKSKFVGWMRKPPHAVLDLHRVPSGESLTAEQRAAASMHQLGVSVEDLHLGLMLSWMDIAVGRAEYFILETEEDRERAFEREVLAAKGTTWTEDVSFLRLFKSLELRKRLAEGGHKINLHPLSEEDEEDEGRPRGDEGPDAESLLGKKATHEQAFAQALRQEHAELVVETLELQTQLQHLQKQVTMFMSDSQAPSRMGDDPNNQDRSSDEWLSEEARYTPQLASSSPSRQSDGHQSRVNSRLSASDSSPAQPRVLSQAASSASRSSTGSRQGSAPPTLRTSAAGGQHIPKEPDPATPPADGPPEPAMTPAKSMRLPLQAISAWPTASALAAARLSMRPRSSPPNDSTPDDIQLPVHSGDSTVQSRGSTGSSSAVGNDPPRATALFSALIPKAEGKLASMGRLLELRSASAASTARAPPAPLQPQPPGPPPAGP